MPVHNAHVIETVRRTAKRDTCVCPQKNIHTSRAHSQYTYLLTILLMLCYLAQYSTTLEGSVQYAIYDVGWLG